MTTARLNGYDYTMVHPTEVWQTATRSLADSAAFRADVSSYVTPKQVDAPTGKGS